MMKFYGVSASHGFAIGKVFLLDTGKIKVKQIKISEDEIPEQIDNFRKAVLKTKEEINIIMNRVAMNMGEREAEIFKAHLLVLEDPLLIIEVVEKVKKEQINVDFALWEVLELLTQDINSLGDELMRERVVDIYDIGRRILQNLAGTENIRLEKLSKNTVVISRNLTPSDTAQMKKDEIVGFATDIGGRTSHTAIMARAMEIPAVVGLRDIASRVKNEDTIIIDGCAGLVIVSPDEDTISEYQRKQKEFEIVKSGLMWLRDLPAQTKDGYRVVLSANIEFPNEVDIIKKEGAEGVGLYRTEFLYLNRIDLPTEEEQFSAYKQVILGCVPHPVIIRTLDLGGDKFLSYLGTPAEVNPFLGLRAIRLSLKHSDIFRNQLRAILRASAFGKTRIMFPLISDLQELLQAKIVVHNVMDELDKQGFEFDSDIDIGIMIETPSAAMTVDALAKEVDFFSIGTNDLVQYTLAVDRINEEIAYLYNPLHPSILRLIKQTIDAAHEQRKWVGICGEMASDPLFIVLLLGMGLDELSMVSNAIPKIKEIIRSVTIQEAKEIANIILSLNNTVQIENTLKDFMSNRFGHLM